VEEYKEEIERRLEAVKEQYEAEIFG